MKFADCEPTESTAAVANRVPARQCVYPSPKITTYRFRHLVSWRWKLSAIWGYCKNKRVHREVVIPASVQAGLGSHRGFLEQRERKGKEEKRVSPTSVRGRYLSLSQRRTKTLPLVHIEEAGRRGGSGSRHHHYDESLHVSWWSLVYILIWNYGSLHPAGWLGSS